MCKLRGLPILRHTTLKDVSKELGISTTKLHKMRQEGAIERVSNSLKPFLT
jgi:DNA-binding Xre family transcriptional regulator